MLQLDPITVCFVSDLIWMIPVTVMAAVDVSWEEEEKEGEDDCRSRHDSVDCWLYCSIEL